MRSIAPAPHTRSVSTRPKAANRNAHRRRRAQRRKSVQRRLRRIEVAFAQSLSLPDLPRLGLESVAGSGLRLGKVVSLISLTVIIAALYWMQAKDAFYVYAEDVKFENITYLADAELYRLTDLEGLNVFWVNPAVIAAQVEKHPYVVAAQVEVVAPASVTIAVTEAQPVGLWITDSGTLWLLADGTALPARGTNPPGLVEIVDGPQQARAVTSLRKLAIDPYLLQATRTLNQRIPGLTSLRYAAGAGLYFALPNTTTLVYWGDGQHIEEKLRNLASIQETLLEARQTAQRIDVRYVAKPYYK